MGKCMLCGGKTTGFWNKQCKKCKLDFKATKKESMKQTGRVIIVLEDPENGVDRISSTYDRDYVGQDIEEFIVKHKKKILSDREEYFLEIEKKKEDEKKREEPRRICDENYEKIQKLKNKYADVVYELFPIAWIDSRIEELLIENNNDINKALHLVEKEIKEAQIEREMEKIKQRGERRRIREEAERRVFGKTKPKRASLTEEEKEPIFRKFNNQCVACGTREGLHIHHKDNNPENNSIENLSVLCGVCHKKVHMKVR